ncbi:CopD family protein [Magnetococcus sp. PR-3]|uniref:CopD family protein n=1 Tax=Magnetococcus sp. PR-3 TaxID=3120355 RepID=UPI002FCDEFAA
MFFAHNFLRPASEALEPKYRIPLWAGVFSRFFPWVWGSVVILPVTGYWMIFVEMGGMGSVGLHVHLMQLIGLVMILLYSYVYFVLYRPFRRLAKELMIPEAGMYMKKIRPIILTNLFLGLIASVLGGAGRYLF